MGRIKNLSLFFLILLLSAPQFAQNISTAPRFEIKENPTYPSERGTFILGYDGEPATAVGLSGGGEFIAAARYPADMFSQMQGFQLYKVLVFVYEIPQSAALKIYRGGTNSQPGILAASQTVDVNSLTSGEWNTISLDEPVIVGDDAIWAGIELYSDDDFFPIGVDAGPGNPDGGWTFFANTWSRLQDFGIEGNFNIKIGISDNPGGNIVYPSNPNPSNSAQNVPYPEYELTWTNPLEISATRLYFSEDFNAVLNNEPSAIVSDGFNQNFVFDSYYASPLNPNTTYYWKVSVQTNSGQVVNGLNWSFTTLSEIPPDSSVAFLQLVHNAADPALALVDIYINGDLAAEDVAFRQASPYLYVEGNQTINVAIAPPNAGFNAALISKDIYVAADMIYTAIASGVADTYGFTPNPDGNDISADLYISQNPVGANTFGLIKIQAFHGVTDAPTVSLTPTSFEFNIENISYSDFSPNNYATSSLTEINVIPTGSGQPLVSYELDLSPYSNELVTLFASGFLNPPDPNNPSFGLFLVDETGNVIELQAVNQQNETANVQLIHNSPDVELQTVKVWVNGQLVLPEFSFREATPYVELPALDSIVVGIGFPFDDQPIVNYPLILQPDKNYVAIVNGVYSLNDYQPNPNNLPIGLSVNITENSELSAVPGMTRIFVNHGATDAPGVDVFARDSVQLADNLFYAGSTNYLMVPSQDYILDITPFNDNSTILASYNAPLSQLAGQSAVVFASGFLDPASNQNGEAFGLFVALPGGDVIQLPPATGSEQLIVSIPEINFNYNMNNTTVEVPVHVTEVTGEGIIAYQFSVVYNSELLTATGIETSGTLSGNNWTVFENIQEPGIITVGAFGTGELSGSGELLKLKFDVNGIEGSSFLGFAEFAFNSGNPVPILQNGVININPGLCGDANEDGELFAEDAALTAQHAIGLITLTPGGEQNADVDYSGEVTAFDAALILREVVGLPLPVITCFGNDTSNVNEAPAGGMILSFEPFEYNDLGAEMEVSYRLTGMNQDDIYSFQFEMSGLNSDASVTLLNLDSDYLTFYNREDESYRSAILNVEGISGSAIGFKLRMNKNNPVEDLSLFNILANNQKAQDLVITSVDDNLSVTDFNLVGAYPNPFNPSTNIVFEIPERSVVTLEVYDILGRKIKTLFDGDAATGRLEVKWNGDNEFGNTVATGNYIILMRSGNFIKSLKVNLLK